MTRRQSVYVEGYSHANPIPAACRLGDVVMSGIVYGLDPATGKVAPTLEEQCALMFRHVRRIMEQAGGSVDDIVKLTVWMVDRSQRDVLNAEWLRMFPDPETRPARQTMAGTLGNGMLIQCDFMAVSPLGGGSR